MAQLPVAAVLAALERRAGVTVVQSARGGLGPTGLMSRAAAAAGVGNGVKALVIARASDRKATAGVTQALRRAGLPPMVQEVSDAWATEAHVTSLTATAKRVGVGAVVGVGCGATLNLAKAVAGRVTNPTLAASPGDVWRLATRSLPLITWPTTPSLDATLRSCRTMRGDGVLQEAAPTADSAHVAVLDAQAADDVAPRELWAASVAALCGAVEVGAAAVGPLDTAGAHALILAACASVGAVAAAGDAAALSPEWRDCLLHTQATLGCLVGGGGPAPPSDAIMRVITERYHAVAAEVGGGLAPEVVDWAGDAIEDRLAAIEGDGDDGDDDDDTHRGSRGGSSNVAVPPALLPAIEALLLAPSYPGPGTVLPALLAAFPLPPAATVGAGASDTHRALENAALRLTLYRHTASYLTNTAAMFASWRAGIASLEGRMPPATRRALWSALGLKDADETAVAEAGEVERACTAFPVAPSAKDIRSMLAVLR